MAFHQPDPHYAGSKKAAANLRLAAWISAGFVALLWMILLLDAITETSLLQYGLRPGAVDGLLGVFTAPLLHGGFEHLFNNSIPLLVGLTACLFLYPHASLLVIPAIWLGSGLLGWFIGRPSLHFGASGLLYGLLAFVFLSGVLRRDMRSVSVSLLIGFFYGTMIWGVFPIRPNMSWELHLSGAFMGLLMAVLLRKWDRVPLRHYDWEDDDSPPAWYPEGDEDNRFNPGEGAAQAQDQQRKRQLGGQVPGQRDDEEIR
jgi:membrane associated rhomboid family serine protease